MKQNEKQLFKELCKFKSLSFDEKLLAFASPNVLGQLFFNRMQGIAYDTLKHHGLLGKVNREFRNSLKYAYEHNIEKNNSFLQCVKYVSSILTQCDFNVAMLKGAYLCFHYPKGYRTSNDIDLLVLPKDVTALGSLLLKEGFKQGNIRNDEFIPASRKEIIESKMMRGETVPYIKEVNLLHMKYLEVDINFSLDYKNSETALLENILSKTEVVEENGVKIPTLNKYDFFLHLCSHLYKEATTLPWIEMHRDMTLYKYADIYLLLSEMSENDILAIFNCATVLGLVKICAYTILETAELFDIDNTYAVNLAKEVLKEDDSFILTIVSPKDKKSFIYSTPGACERFFMENRVKDLKEVSPYGKA